MKKSEIMHDVHIMHRGGLLIGGPRAIEEPALWVVDSRWGSSAVEEKA